MPSGKSWKQRYQESGAIDADRCMEAERAAKLKPYRATIHLTILAENKREAKRALELARRAPRAFGHDVRVDSIEGPEAVE